MEPTAVGADRIFREKVSCCDHAVPASHDGVTPTALRKIRGGFVRSYVAPETHFRGVRRELNETSCNRPFYAKVEFVKGGTKCRKPANLIKSARRLPR